ncbi:MAG: hypothetical protein K2I64_03425 [Muribaculaceae bacterium]|nr:hypothetical protein [Muribaculaceae bacterium]
MEENNTHEEFGELKNQYSSPQNFSIRDCFIPQMRENLIARNEGETELQLYPSDVVVDLNTCQLTELYHADATLFHNKK